MNRLYTTEENYYSDRKAYVRHVRIMQMYADPSDTHSVYLRPQWEQPSGRPCTPVLPHADPPYPQQHTPVALHRRTAPHRSVRGYRPAGIDPAHEHGRRLPLRRQDQNGRRRARSKGSDYRQERDAAVAPGRDHTNLAPGTPAGRPYTKEYGLVYRKRFDEPGLYFRVPFGPFAGVLNGQVAQPQRLKPSQRVDGLLQVYDLLRPVSAEQIALAETGTADRSFDFQPFTPQTARLLGVPLSSGSRPPGHPQAAGAGSRFQPLFRLQLITDPSVEATVSHTEPVSAAPPIDDGHDRPAHQGG